MPNGDAPGQLAGHLRARQSERIFVSVGGCSMTPSLLSNFKEDVRTALDQFLCSIA
jgi:hypothetical protein